MKKIILIHPEGNINNNPNLTGIVEILCENGYTVEIVSPRRPEISQKAPSIKAAIRLIDVPDFNFALYFSFLVPPDLTEKPDLLHTYLNQTFRESAFIFGVDRGIFDAFILSQALNVPYGLISYEIYFEEETSKAFKEPEILACRGISFAVCQDRIRASLLSRENHIPLDRIIDIPVAARGFIPSFKRGFKIHESLNLCRDTKIALYMGSISTPWSMIGELLKTIPRWPPEWILLLHHRYGAQASSRFLNQFDYLRNTRKVFLSPFQQLDFQELYQILHNVDVGMAFYIPQKNDSTAGNNLKYIGMASGKIATYLQHGIPIMVNEIGLWSDTVRKYKLGRVINSASEIPDILKNLTAKALDEYRVNIQTFYEKSYDLNLSIHPLLQRLHQLLETNFNGFLLSAKETSSEKTDDMPALYCEETSMLSDHSSLAIKVSAIVSTYNSERFIRGCLEDLVNQTLSYTGWLEIIVVDSGSQQNEKSIVEEFQRNHKNIEYIRTEKRESVFAAWNRGIQAASGKYITNANTDDRHRRDALEVMADTLDKNPGAGVVYADVIITETEDETFEKHTPAGYYRWLDYDRKNLSVGCFIGPQPMWRKSLHQKYGYFNETFSTSGDWEFWLRIAEDTTFLHIRDFLGLYLRSPGSLEHKNGAQRLEEDRSVYRTYIPKYLPAYEEHFAGVLKSDPSNSVHVYRYGQVLATFEEYDKAMGLYSSYLQKNPDNRAFAAFLEDLKKLKARRVPVQAPPAPLPEKIMTYLNLADAHIANNDPASARKSIREALHHASGHAQLCSMLANILENLPCSGSAAESPGTQGNNI